MNFQLNERVAVLYLDGAKNISRFEGTIIAYEPINGEDGYRVNIGAVAIHFKETELTHVQGQSG
jgi:hypothetical protein